MLKSGTSRSEPCECHLIGKDSEGMRLWGSSGIVPLYAKAGKRPKKQPEKEKDGDSKRFVGRAVKVSRSDRLMRLWRRYDMAVSTGC